MPEKPMGRLLVVDDEISLMIALRNTLSEEGYDVVGVTSGKEALVALRKGKFDVILSDLVMPEMDGLALLQQALVIDPELVAIVMTGHGSIPTAIAAMKTGAIDYVQKPLKLGALVPALEKALTLRRLRQENEKLAKQLTAHTAALEAANRELEAFSDSVSHDLRNPLRTISGFVDLILGGYATTLSPEVVRYVGFIRDGANQMNELIDALLSFSRIGRQALVRKPIDLERMCWDAFGDLVGERVGRKVELRVGTLPKILGDPVLLRQVFVNLLSNAQKFTRQRAEAVIEVGFSSFDPKEGPVFFVRDNGVGFNMRDAEKLFDVFQRLHPMDEFEGTGVGLATVRRIIERHGGSIWTEALPEKGATFFMKLPLDFPAPINAEPGR